MAKLAVAALLISAFPAVSASGAASASLEKSLLEDDACLAGGEACGLNALQLASRSVQQLEMHAVGDQHTGNMAPQQLTDAKADEAQPNFGGFADRVRNATRAAAQQAAQVVQNTAQAVQAVISQQALPDFGSVIDAIANASMTTVDSSSNILEELIARANTIAAAANITLPILSPAEVDGLSKSLVSKISAAQGESKDITNEAVQAAQAKVAETIRTLNNTALETLEDAQQAATEAAESVAQAMNSTFAELPPLVQREIMQVIADLTLRAEVDTQAIALQAAQPRRANATETKADSGAGRSLLAPAAMGAVLLAVLRAVA